MPETASQKPQPEAETIPVVNLSQVNVDQVKAELVRANQTIAESIHASEVDLQVSLAGMVQTQKVVGRRVAVGVIESDTALLSETLILAAQADQMTLKGRAVAVSAENLEAENVSAAGVIATNVRATNIRAGVLLSRNVQGNVETMFDTRTALLTGISAGIVTGLVVLAGKLLFRRRK